MDPTMIERSSMEVKPFSPTLSTERVIVYIDGFNLYFGMRDSGFKRYLWLNLKSLSINLLTKQQKLVCTRYFTSRVSGPSSKQRRQSLYLDALETLKSKTFTVAFGKYQNNPFICSQCQANNLIPNEKMTDVNIAVALMEDALNDEFDTAILISADSDLCPAISAIRRIASKKKIVVGFPPGRYSADLKQAASASFVVGRAKLAASQFPDLVTGKNGYPLHRPSRWT